MQQITNEIIHKSHILSRPMSDTINQTNQNYSCAIGFPHRNGDVVRVWTRTLREVTDGVPELVERVRALPCERAVLDGETLALDDDGRPRAFQDTMSRFGSEAGGETDAAGVLLRPFFFDLLHLDGRDLLDEPLHVRLDALERLLADDTLIWTTARE